MGIKIVLNQDETITLKGDRGATMPLSVVQAQNLLLTLGCEQDALFEALVAFDEHGWNTCDLGVMGGFIYGEFIGVNH